MKKTVPLFAFLFIHLISYSKTLVIENLDMQFSPAEITITIGDTVQFNLENLHNAVEVSKATWDAKGTTALPGGFSLGKGGGIVLPSKLTLGTHYYVCTPHASLGMRGTIIVKSANGINENNAVVPISIFPSPAADFITIKSSNTLGTVYSIIASDGKQVFSGKLNVNETTVSVYGWVPGIYYFMAEGIETKAFTVVHP